MEDFAEIQAVPLQEVLAGEATHFTPWLARNLKRISDELGMQLFLEETEAAAGDFSADIVARDLSTNGLVVIENQYGITDHRHLGQIITYSSKLKAKAVVWIAERIRNEHKTAIDFLNNNLRDSLQLFAFEVKVIKIDGSRPAFLFDLVCKPPESEDVPSKESDASDINQRYRAFFQQLIDELRTEHRFTNARQGQPQNWYAFSSENSKVFTYGSSFAKGGKARVELYIDCKDRERNKALFKRLQADAQDIHAEFGSELTWESLDNRQACRIAIYRDGEIDAPTEDLADLRAWMIANLLKFKKVFPTRIADALD